MTVGRPSQAATNLCYISLVQLEAALCATRDALGSDGFGIVYRGTLQSVRR